VPAFFRGAYIVYVENDENDPDIEFQILDPKK